MVLHHLGGGAWRSDVRVDEAWLLAPQRLELIVASCNGAPRVSLRETDVDVQVKVKSFSTPLRGGDDCQDAVTVYLREPLGDRDVVDEHTTALGLPEIGPPLGPVKGFLGAPIRLRGVRAGNLYLSDKEGGGAFTQDDEETLAMFASHAAMAIANARRHREEQRARAYLETLIDTTPVGPALLRGPTCPFQRVK